MSIINQALKKAQREQLLREAQVVQHLVHLNPPQSARRWFLGTLGGAVALGVGIALYAWTSAAAGRMPRAVKAPATAGQSTLVVHPTPSLSPPATPVPQVVRQSHPVRLPAEARLSPPLPEVRAAVNRPFSARVEDAQPQPTPAVQPAARTNPPSVTAPEATLGGVTQPDRASARTLFNRALAAQEAGEPGQALMLLQQAVEVDPSMKAAYNGLGNLYYQHQQYQQAIAMYQKALAIDPGYAKARNNLGGTYLRLAMDGRALVELQQAVQADSTYGLAYYNLACVYARAGHSETAAQFLQQAIALEPRARTWAQTDDDFTRVRTAPVMQQLLGP